MSDPFESYSTEPPQKQAPSMAFPNSVESEKGVIGCILADSVACFDEILQSGIMPEWFFVPRHRFIYAALMDLAASNSAIDLITTVEALRKADKLDEVGGMLYLSELQGFVPSAENWSLYAKTLREKWVARRAMESCMKATDKLCAGTDPSEVLAMHEREIIAISSDSTPRRVRTMKELAKDAINRIEQRFKGVSNGTKTGFPDLDRATDGLHPQQLWVVAGRPGTGKTTLAVNIAENVAVQWKASGVPKAAVVFSMEMSDSEVEDRLIASNADINMRRIGPSTTQAEMKRIFHAITKTSSLDKHLIIDDSPRMPVSMLCAKARHYARRNNAGLIVVDYLQLAQPDANTGSRQSDIAAISSDLKSLAKELGVPVIALAQLNREVEKDTKRKPRMSDLRESGQIEQDADFVGILYNKQTSDAVAEGQPIPVDMRVCKQRGGGSNMDVSFLFFKEHTKFASVNRGIDDP